MTARAVKTRQVKLTHYEFPCEHATKAVIPSIRAVVARILVERFGLTKYAAAKILDVTPAAITNYLKKKRGDKYSEMILQDKRLCSKAEEIAKLLIESKGARTPEAFMRYKNLVCEICSEVNMYAKIFGCRVVKPVAPTGDASSS